MTEERKHELLQLDLSLDDIKFLAHDKGFNLATIPPKIKMLPCVCGNNTKKWYDPVGLWNGPEGKQYKCGKCGFESGWAKTETKAKKLWNDAVTKATAISDKDRLKESDN